MDRLVEERDLDATRFRCCRDEDLYPYGDLTDLSNQDTSINHFNPAAPKFHCPGCRKPFGYFFMRDRQYRVTMARWVGAGFGHLLDSGAGT
jgi:hypothetical protein